VKLTQQLDTPADNFLDEEVVRRVLDLKPVGRPLSRAEKRAVLGPVLDQAYECALDQLNKPKITLVQLVKLFRMNHDEIAKMAEEVRPGHRERMEQARTSYRSLEMVALGRKPGQGRNGRTRSPEKIVEQRRAWNRKGKGAA
jgi:DNA-directed RNA polymerase specialized sigma24 family protein